MLPQPSLPDPTRQEARVEPLRVEISSPDPKTVVVTPTGEADAATAPRLRQALREAGDSGRPRVIVDLDRLTFLDATTLNVLVEARRRVSTTGGDLRVRCHTDLGAMLLRTARLDHMLDQGSDS